MNTLETLSPREREILTMYARGLIGKQIADQLNMSEHTVNDRRRAIARKLGVNLWAACAQAGKAGWV
jgi:DNA-binding NarL/FixJ family response regulator